MDISVTSVPDAPTPHAAQRDSGNELQVHGDHLAMPAPRQSTTARRAAPADDTPRTCPVAGPQHSIAATASPATNVSSPTARPSFEAALVRMTAFLNSVCLALQAPLTARPAITTPAAAPTPRRSGRLANQALNSTVRPSKKGEILVMKKLGVVPREQDAEQVSTAEFDKFLHSTMQPKHFAALRDIFPAANALSDDELMRITSLAVWNTRGLNARTRRDSLREVVHDANASIVCLQETKLAVISPFLLSEMLGSNFASYSYLPSSGVSGGVLIACRSPEITCAAIETGNYSVTVSITTGAQTQPWCLTSVYGPQPDEDKIVFLDELRSIHSRITGPWMNVGDFNLILCASDKSNDYLNRRNMGRFRRFVNELQLKDVYLHG
uniref:Endonuclease/exonuclease/phosphatase domain-containing protein n=1 Tax=Setaria viridis TaxID=4556 RepID=A0A4V6D6Q9_SETVI|nr:hypothetical protein SEVIR_5G233400v2 [Setaria viridis]